VFKSFTDQMLSVSKRATAVCCLLALGMSYYYFALFLPRAGAKLDAAGLNQGYRFGCDLYPLWLTSRGILESHAMPYSSETARQIQIGLYGRPLDANRPSDPPADYRAFAYPIYSDFPVIPFARVPFSVIRRAGALLFSLMMIATCLLWLRFLNLQLEWRGVLAFLVLTLTSYPFLEGLFSLQPSVVVALLLAATAFCLARQRLGTAGILLAFASVKPQLIVIVGTWLLIWSVSDFKRRRNFAFGFLAMIALLVLTADLVVPGWMGPWIHSLVAYRGYTDPVLPQYVLGSMAGTIVCLGLIVAACLIGFRALRAASDSAQFALTFSLLLAITVLIVPSSVAVYEHMLLVPAILWLLAQKGAILGGQPRDAIPLVFGRGRDFLAMVGRVGHCSFLVGIPEHQRNRTDIASAPHRCRRSVRRCGPWTGTRVEGKSCAGKISNRLTSDCSIERYFGIHRPRPTINTATHGLHFLKSLLPHPVGDRQRTHAVVAHHNDVFVFIQLLRTRGHTAHGYIPGAFDAGLFDLPWLANVQQQETLSPLL
jgi:hypothetical protein